VTNRAPLPAPLPRDCGPAFVRAAVMGHALSFRRFTPPPMCGCFPMSNRCRAYWGTKARFSPHDASKAKGHGGGNESTSTVALASGIND
jgi:hypothetical protein